VRALNAHGVHQLAAKPQLPTAAAAFDWRQHGRFIHAVSPRKTRSFRRESPGRLVAKIGGVETCKKVRLAYYASRSQDR
jgi:hypothetical protein